MIENIVYVYIIIHMYVLAVLVDPSRGDRVVLF